MTLVFKIILILYCISFLYYLEKLIIMYKQFKHNPNQFVRERNWGAQELQLVDFINQTRERIGFTIDVFLFVVIIITIAFTALFKPIKNLKKWLTKIIH